MQAENIFNSGFLFKKQCMRFPYSALTRGDGDHF